MGSILDTLTGRTDSMGIPNPASHQASSPILDAIANRLSSTLLSAPSRKPTTDELRRIIKVTQGQNKPDVFSEYIQGVVANPTNVLNLSQDRNRYGE